MSRAEEIEGIVLCRVGDHQIAFPAAAVGHIEMWEPGGVPAPLARLAFGLPATAGKLLVYGDFSLVVDALEILADRSRLMPVPAMLHGAVGGSLRGFVLPGMTVANQPATAAGADRATTAGVVPLLGLAEFSAFVSKGGPT